MSDTEQKITRRWARPSTPFHIEDAEFAVAEGDREFIDYKARWSQEEIARRTLGYVCIKCWEPHETPFPDKCSLCGFPMKTHQLIVFEQEFKGFERAPWPERIEKELDALEDKHERNFYETKSGIVIPRSLR